MRPSAHLAMATAALLVLLAACAGAASPAPSGGPSGSPSPAPSGGAPLTAAELKIRIWDRFGVLWYCDPDFYPIQRGEEIDHARERWAEVTADPAVLTALEAHLGITLGTGDPSDADRLAIYRAWKQLNATALDPIGNGRYRFDFLAEPVAGAAEGTRTTGTITETGQITVDQQGPAPEPICPICLAAGTMIDTPDGPRPVEAFRIGDAAWTMDLAGHRVAGTVVAIGSTPVPAGHEVVRLVLSDGRSVTASPGHPLADGRRLGELRVGDQVDGATVTGVDRQPYAGAETFDLLVSGPTGAYWTSGIPLRSTLRP
jgi:hypothetical protein